MPLPIRQGEMQELAFQAQCHRQGTCHDQGLGVDKTIGGSGAEQSDIGAWGIAFYGTYGCGHLVLKSALCLTCPYQNVAQVHTEKEHKRRGNSEAYDYCYPHHNSI